MGVDEPRIQASLLGDAIDHGPAAVFVADEQMRYIAVNRLACEMLGYTRAELLELRLTDVVCDPQAAAEYADVVAHGAPRMGMSRLRRKDGSELDFEYRASETLVAGVQFWVSVGWPAPGPRR